jgi:hypothetical protein
MSDEMSGPRILVDDAHFLEEVAQPAPDLFGALDAIALAQASHRLDQFLVETNRGQSKMSHGFF